jgi:DNA/RNA endonuclease G (NUC1)/PKD repeat protein
MPSPTTDVAQASPTGVVISQVYGGGGNAGATIKNDYIELYNGSPNTVSLAGWSVQYASTTGTTWAVTALSGSIQSGHYYLVQEAAGTGGTVALVPDATGSIAMAGGAGKVALVNSTTALTGTGCPFVAAVQDYVGYGTTSNCFEGAGPTAPSLTNTTAAFRKDGGRQDTNDNGVDFANAAPAPRNSSSPVNPPLTGVTVTISPSAPSAAVGITVNFTASATSGGSNAPITSAAWTSSNTAVATIDPATGVATTVAAGTTTIGVTVTTGSGNGSSNTQLTVTAPPQVVSSITVTPTPATINQGATQQFTATAYDASNQPISGVTFTWASSATSIATVNSSGLATGVSGGDADITATSGSVVGTATLHVIGVAPYVPPDIRVSELHYDNTGTDADEKVEIEGPVGTVLTGWSIAFYNGDPASSSTPLKVYNTAAVNGTLIAPITCGTRGVLAIAIPASPGIQNGGTAGAQPDGLALVDNTGALVEFLSYEGSFTAADGPAVGVTSRNIGVMEDNPVPAAGLSLHRSANGATWAGPAASDMGYVNACGAPPPASITFSGRSPTADPPLPVGFEAQVFATETVGGTRVNTTFTWTSETPAIASVDQDGVLRALTAGTAILRATATDGATATYSLPTVVGTQSSATYGNNVEFGTPTDGTPGDDFIITRLEYTSSWNKNLGRPNWVSEKLDASTYGAEDRCNCFTFDPELEAQGFPKYTTADYTGAGAFAGYGIDRGHMTRSADRTAGNLDNARTYYFSNVLPQAAANNQVTWKLLEDTLGTIAENQGKAVYVIEGGSSSAQFPSKGFIKGQNKVEMPGAVWKVAVIMDHGKGLADVHSVNDVAIIAIITPNDPSVNPDWHTYKTTVDAVEALSGYDLLSLLEDNLETAIESNDHPPVAAVTGATSGAEGSALSFSASGSTDPDAGDALTYAWTFGDGTTGSGVSPTHAFADNGTYTVTVKVTDSHGVYSSASMTTTISNVAPVISSFTASPSPASVGGTVTATVNFTDAGAGDTHTAVITWGDGTSSTVAAGSSTQAIATHTYASAGFYTVGATLTDDDNASATANNTSIVVFDASAGYLDASGFVQKTQLGQIVNFALSLQYVGGASAPTGTFEIQAGSPRATVLTSTGFDYMVFNGNSVTVRGTGTWSDGSAVSFLVTGTDVKTTNSAANGDFIRIKVTRVSDGVVLYDTEPGVAETAPAGTLVKGGSLTIRH